MQVSIVDTKDIESMWPFIEGYMKKAAKYTYGRFEAEDIKDGLLSKPQQLWIAFDDIKIYGAVVTEVIKYPRMKVLIMHFTAGKELITWKDLMLSNLQNFAKVNDCKIIESYGRPGWAKVFKNDGYKQQFIFYELPLEN